MTEMIRGCSLQTFKAALYAFVIYVVTKIWYEEIGTGKNRMDNHINAHIWQVSGKCFILLKAYMIIYVNSTYKK